MLVVAQQDGIDLSEAMVARLRAKEGGPAIPVEIGDFSTALAGVGLEGEFDLVYSSSVIEHVPRERRATFAAEVARVGRGLYVQTPAYSFPVEPHSLLPFAHWLPHALRRPYWRLGVAGDWEAIELLRRGEMEALFSPPRAERLGPLVKSWVSVRAPS